MTPLFIESDFLSAKSKDKLPCICLHCKNTFYLTKHTIQKINNPNSKHSGDFCSIKCKNISHSLKLSKKLVVNCLNCNVSFEKKQSQIDKSLNHFCSRSCAATYNNKNKTHGNRRSKLEIWLEQQLTTLYPDLEIHFNQKSAINSELDIYIPSLNLAFELNGIFHYEPIYGSNKLNQIQENDISKSKACHDAKIDLCIIDTSTQNYFKESTSQKYLNIINNIIKERFIYLLVLGE